jgi:hypothetical protein
MPIFHDRIADQVEELLPEFFQEEGPRFVSFIKSYFEFLEKGQLIYKDAADVDYIGLEDGTIAGEEFNSAGERGNLLQESGTYAPSSITSARFNYEIDIDQQDNPKVAKTSFEKNEFVVGSTSGALGRIDVIGTSSNLYIEQFSEAQFDIDETIVGKTSAMEAKVASFKASPLHAANNLLSYADVDKTSGDFLEYFRRDFMPFIDRDVLANKRLLQKHIHELYLSKGTKESYEFLFRILYGLEAEVTDPSLNVIRPSTSEFSEPTVMRLYAEKDATVYKRGLIQKFAGNKILAKAYINKSSGMSGTNDTTNAYELELVTPYVGTFNVGDDVVLSDRDGFRIDLDAIVRGVMTDIDPTESSIYVGIEDGQAGDLEDIIRLESADSIYIVDANGDNILMEDGDELIFEHALGGEFYQAQGIELETASGVGILLSEESVYDINNILVTDYALIHENTDIYPHYSGGPATRTMGGGMYTEQASLGSLYSESETFNYNSPAGGTASQSLNVIGSIGRGGITEIVIDDAGTGYTENDEMVFINTGTGGQNGEARVSVSDGLIELENETTPGVFSYTGDGSNKVFQGRGDTGALTLGFDPRKVEVYVAGTELTRETEFTTDQAGTKVTITSAPANNALVEIHQAFRGLLLESPLRPEQSNGAIPDYFISNEASGAIRKIQITSPGLHYESLPKVFMGGYIYYDAMTTGTTFTVGEILTSTNSKTLVVASHDTEKKRIVVYKRSTDPAGVPTGTVTGGTSNSVCTILSHTVTAGSGAKLWAYGDEIGSIKKLKMQVTGHDFVQGGIGNYKQNAIIKDISATLVVNTTITANLTGATATISNFNGDLNLLVLKDVRGIFNDGDYCTTSDSKNFIIGKINPATARGKLGSTALLDGNYTNDTGFPSVISQKIHDNLQYQDYSYLLKVGKSINEYRSLVKSLLSPAGTIFFGEVSIRNTVDAKADVYNATFDGTKTTRSFIPTLIIGSRTDTADLIQEDGTVPGGIMGLNQLTLTGTGAAGVYTGVTPQVPSGGSGLELTIQVNSDNTSYQNIVITNRGTGYTAGETVTIIQSMVGGSGSTVFATFEIESVGSPYEAASSETFTSTTTGIGRFDLESGEGIITTERFLAVTNTTVRDQASGILYTSVPDEPAGAQAYSVGETITPTTRDFTKRQLMAEVSPKGHRVHKEIDIFPTYNQHKIYYTTLDNALAVGTKIKGGDDNGPGGARGIVMEHDTTRNNAILRYTSAVSGTGVVGTYYVTGVSSASGSGATFDITLDTTTSTSSILIRNTGSGFVPNETITIQEKHVGGAWNDTDTFAVLTVSKVDSDYIIVHQDLKDQGTSGSQFSVDAIEHIDTGANYFTATSIELHHVPEVIPSKEEPSTITADTTITSANQKISNGVEGGGETYTHVGSGIDPASTKGFHGRGKVLVAGDHNETYDSEMRQRKVNIISSPIFTQSVTQRGRTFSAIPRQTRTLNIQSSRTLGSNTVAANSNGTALRIDSAFNTHDGSNISFGYRPAGQKLYETTNFLIETLITEDGSRLTHEPDNGQCLGEDFSQAGAVILEDDTDLLWEDATTGDETVHFVSEESSQNVSYNLISESTDDFNILLEDGESLLHEDGRSLVTSESISSGVRLIDETDSLPLLSEDALMIGQKESNQVGPTISDLGFMMFSENYSIMKKIQLDGGSGISSGDDLLLETGEHMTQESPSEGIKISDISSIYPGRFVHTLERDLGRKTNLTHSAVVQTG